MSINDTFRDLFESRQTLVSKRASQARNVKFTHKRVFSFKSSDCRTVLNTVEVQRDVKKSVYFVLSCL